MDALRDDGERFLPDAMGGVTALEHLHRYLFALQLAKGRSVLDIASGEGYGTALLAAHARQAVGVDIDPATVAHAARKYVRPGRALSYVEGDCASIPLADGCIELAVSFETIEHHDRHDEMLSELRRVLGPEGLLLISTPDRTEYSERTGLRNPFHVKELDAAEFEALLRRHFRHVALWRQRVVAGSWILDDHGPETVQHFGRETGDRASDGLPAAPYLLALASDVPLPPVRGGVLEQDLAVLASPMLRDTYRQMTELLRTLAAPDSAVLRGHLDGPWYLQHNPDLADPGLDRYRHWIDNGAAECRMPAEDTAQLARELLAERLGRQPGDAARDELARLAAELAQAQETQHSTARALQALGAGMKDGAAAWSHEAEHAAGRHRQLLNEAAEALRAGLATLDAARQREHEELARRCAELLAAADAAAVARTEREREFGAERDALRLQAAQAEQRLRDELASLQARLQETELEASRRQADQREQALQAQAAQQAAHGVALAALQHAADERHQALQRALEQLARAHEAERADAQARWSEQEARQGELLRAERAGAEQRLAAERDQAQRRESRLLDELRELRLTLDRALADSAELARQGAARQEEAARRLAEARDEIERLRTALSDIKASRSWRWTLPMRALSGLLRPRRAVR